MKSPEQIKREKQITDMWYWQDEAKRWQSMGQSYRLLGNVAEARRCARMMLSCKTIADRKVYRKL